MTTQYKITRSDITAESAEALGYTEATEQFKTQGCFSSGRTYESDELSEAYDRGVNRAESEHMANAGQNREADYDTQLRLSKEAAARRIMPRGSELEAPAKPANAHAADAHTPGDSVHNAGPTPTEYGDRWEPLRERLSISQAQYLNTYTRTGDIAALNCLVLGIISQRNETAAERDRLKEQVQTLLKVCKEMLESHKRDNYYDQSRRIAARDSALAAIKFVESEVSK